MNAEMEKYNFEEIPIIDISPFVAGQNFQARKKTAKQIREVCKASGFFYIVNHGISLQLISKLIQSSKTFFNLSLQEKQKIHMKSAGISWKGYFSTGEQYTSGLKDLKQGIYFGQQLSDQSEEVKNKTPLHGKNLFPQHPAELKNLVLQWINQMKNLGQIIMEAIAVSLNLQPNFFRQTICKNPLQLFRIFNYPVPNNPVDRASWGVGQHTDYGLITILLVTDDGLQVKNRENKWITANYVPNSFIINIGDMLQRLTKGLYRSTPHRAKNITGKARMSFPYFFDPGWRCEIKQLDFKHQQDEQVLLSQSELYQRWDHKKLSVVKGTYGQYLMKKVSLVFPQLAKQNL